MAELQFPSDGRQKDEQVPARQIYQSAYCKASRLGSKHARALKAYNEARRIIGFKVANGVVFDRVSALKALAFIRSSINPGMIVSSKSKRAFRWHELDFVSLREDAKDFSPTDAELEDAIAQVSAWRANNGSVAISGQTLGKLLDLSEDERIDQKVTSIVSKDDTPADKRARRLAGWRNRKAADRRQRGCPTREEYEAASLSRTKPWEAEGVSRRTWYNRRANVAQVVPPAVYINRGGSTCADPEDCPSHSAPLRARGQSPESLSSSDSLSGIREVAASAGETAIRVASPDAVCDKVTHR